MKKSTTAVAPAPLPVFENIVLDSLHTIDILVGKGRLYTMGMVANITGYDVRYIRRLCHSRRINHYEFLGRYYLTPAQVQELLKPVPAENPRKHPTGSRPGGSRSGGK